MARSCGCNMSGEKDLSKLLSNMNPILRSGEYVICTIPEDNLSATLQRITTPLMVFRENEGTTLIVERTAADKAGLSYKASWSMITLSIHSDLEAVGFLAAISNALAKEGISVNAVSAYYHDHLFVPIEKAENAMDALQRLSKRANRS
jgi:hypothetical protein